MGFARWKEGEGENGKMQVEDCVCVCERLLRPTLARYIWVDRDGGEKETEGPKERRKRRRKGSHTKRGESVRERLQVPDKRLGNRGVSHHLCRRHDETVMFSDAVSRHAYPAAGHDLDKESIVALVAREEQKMNAMKDGVVDDEWDANTDVKETEEERKLLLLGLCEREECGLFRRYAGCVGYQAVGARVCWERCGGVGGDGTEDSDVQNEKRNVNVKERTEKKRERL